MKTHEIIKKLRLEKGWSQTQLAEMLKISSAGMSHLESGRNSPSLEMVKKIAKLFNVSLDYIVNGKESTGEISEDELEVLIAMREDTAFKEVAIEAAKLKKKVISYLKSYNSQQEAMHA